MKMNTMTALSGYSKYASSKKLTRQRQLQIIARRSRGSANALKS
jgi:hypothetical protein